MNNNLIKKIGIFTGTTLSVFLVCFAVIAYTPPTSNPPADNLPALVNTGSSPQYIEGSLGVGGVLVGAGIIPNLSDETQPTCNASTRGMIWYDYEVSSLAVCGLINWEYVSNQNSIYVPVGAEGYGAGGNLLISKNNEGLLSATSGKVVFLDAKNYGNIEANLRNIDILVVAGGGGGGGDLAGGGGAGGLIFKQNYNLYDNLISVIVGNGGSGSTAGVTRDAAATLGSNGENSVFGSLVAIGGGGGGVYGTANNSNPNKSGKDGGSGGGGGATTDTSYSSGGSGTANQGNSGGGGTRGSNSYYVGGGGGGAGGAGVDGGQAYNDPGDGGEGLYFGNIFGDNYGYNGWFAGGGGGSNYGNNNGTVGGVGHSGGGNGGFGSTSPNGLGIDALANTGSGGGGGSWQGVPTKGGNGGSGVIIIQW